MNNQIEEPVPQGKMAIRTISMPKDTNPHGDIFGGWVVSQMDLAAASIARHHAKSRVVTIAIDSMVFIAPIRVGDIVCCYADVKKVGNTSMVIKVETWVLRAEDEARCKVTEGVFTFVAIDAKGKSRPVIRP